MREWGKGGIRSMKFLKKDRQGKSFNYNEPQFPHPKHEDYNSTEYLRKTE